MSCRKCSMREIPLTMEEVREFMRQEKAKRGMLFGVVIGIVLALVAVVLWVAHRKSKDLEEHYEYFDEDFEDEFDDEDYDDLDEDLYGDEDASTEGVEYVKIKDFMNYDKDEAHQDDFASKEKQTASEKTEEVEEEK
nr:hypothetical protein [uncultured Cellulosilyticum sp.]